MRIEAVRKYSLYPGYTGWEARQQRKSADKVEVSNPSGGYPH